ncbi:MAG TPA: NAD(P)/FAD-dependent oxidoreductase [Luteibaculaceae bacterium]|nr:NAD(P)/FAD-dependent oxidoreductase [Luteibaculaceae bacterium]
MSSKTVDVAIIGGGAAGFFAAAQLVKIAPYLSLTLLEKGNQFLSKVKISGGGRCNVTHACFDAKQLATFYPRGNRELVGPFHRFGPSEVITWFEESGVALKTEVDNRMFPVTNSSQTIIDALMNAVQQPQVELLLQNGVQSISRLGDGSCLLRTNRHEIEARAILFSSGSGGQMWSIIKDLGVSIVDPVPSLFTFNCKSALIKGLMGVSIPHVGITISGTKWSSEGPLLFTHWGLSGPAILKLSAWAARDLAERNYQFEVHIDFLPQIGLDELLQMLLSWKQIHPRKAVRTITPEGVPSALWSKLCEVNDIQQLSFADASKNHLRKLAEQLKKMAVSIEGKSTFKDEFVTAGGVALKEVDFKTMASKQFPNLFFAGEVLNIDAVTGGFNFQAAWTTAFLAAHGIADFFNHP